MEAYRALCAEAERDFDGFWSRLAREELLWHKPFGKVLNGSDAPFFKWFEDGELNASYNCLDRHLKTQPDKTAIVFEADDGKVTRITYKELYRRVCMMANGLKSVGRGKGGVLVIKRPWPAMVRTIWGDPERYKLQYYPADFHGKYYLAGDGASFDADGYIRIMGRIDDVLNVAGHRLGTMEIESALVANPKVAEAAVVGRPDDVTGEAIVAFVVLKQARPDGGDAQRIVKELQDWVGQEIGPIAKPRDIRFGDNLPKTRSGKIMRRLLRSIAKGETIAQDVSTLENPAILDQLKQTRA